jgi:hypothetical protein
MDKTIQQYHSLLDDNDRKTCAYLFSLIDEGLPEAESKVWHGHPVWFLDGNPIAGYSVQKLGVRLMFWSGKSFDEPGLDVVGKKFKDASAFYTSVDDIDAEAVRRWLGKSRTMQWDYKNIIKRRGELRPMGDVDAQNT